MDNEIKRFRKIDKTFSNILTKPYATNMRTLTEHGWLLGYWLIEHEQYYTFELVNVTVWTSTRKPCYRRDDRAMRPIYGCPEKFRESSQTPPATFPEIRKGFLFRSILRMCVQNLKFVALSVREIIGATQKNLNSPSIRPRSIFSQIFKGLLFGWTLLIYLPNLKFVALSVPEIIGGIKTFGQSLYTPTLQFLPNF